MSIEYTAAHHGRKRRTLGISTRKVRIQLFGDQPRLYDACERARFAIHIEPDFGISGLRARTLCRSDQDSIFTSVETQVHEFFACLTIQVASASIESTGAFVCRAVRAPHYDPLHDRIALRRRDAAVDMPAFSEVQSTRGTSETSTSASICTAGPRVFRGSFVFSLANQCQP